jgi:hypothetical protein
MQATACQAFIPVGTLLHIGTYHVGYVSYSTLKYCNF